jgi:DNA-directed RNA polymerase subunit F
MATPTIIKEEPLSMGQVKEEIEKIKKRDKELGFRTVRTEEYLQSFVKKDTAKLVETLKKLNIARLKDEYIVKIADLLPTTVDDLKAVLQGYTVTVNKDNMAKIVEEVKKFV